MTILISIICLVILLTPVFMTFWETINFENLPADRYQSRMRDTGLMFVGLILFWLLLTGVIILFYSKSYQVQKAIVPQLDDQRISDLLEINAQESMFNKYFPSLIIGEHEIYIFKPTRLITIRKPEVKKYSIVQTQLDLPGFGKSYQTSIYTKSAIPIYFILFNSKLAEYLEADLKKAVQKSPNVN